jgi:malic enzyme
MMVSALPDSPQSSPLEPPAMIGTTKRGVWLLRHAATNKDLAFTKEEREALGLNGLLPARVEGLKEQVAREMEHLRSKPDELEKYIGLVSLQDRNRVLFYRLLVEHTQELMPLVYTPTVGQVCQQYSHIFRGPRGIWLTPEDIDCIPARLRNAPNHDVRLIVVTDNERILGLGDQGAGGMGIPVGKLTLYVVASGIHPSQVLPVSLDLGTNNPKLLDDPLYLGHRSRRIEGELYDRFIENFVEAVRQVFPNALLQWEDFHKRHAFDLLDSYRHRLPSFNDDIQGTGAVVLSGIMAYARHTGTKLADQRFLLLGAGEACSGAVRMIRTGMRREGASEDTIARSMVLFDSQGLLHSSREGLDAYKRDLAVSPSVLESYQLSPQASVLEAIERVKPTVLIGATASPGLFRRELIEALARGSSTPLVMPLSNPTSKAECSPAEVVEWTQGRALVATGSPFSDVEYRGKRHTFGQANNLFIFPGVGLGAILSELGSLPDDIFSLASETLANCVSTERLQAGAVYPEIDELREVTTQIAAAIVRYASEHKLGRRIYADDIDAFVRGSMWYPDYVPVYALPENSPDATDYGEMI